MMTWVSLRSGVASIGTVCRARHPARQPIAITARTITRCLTEKSMILAITINLPGGGWLRRGGWLCRDGRRQKASCILRYESCNCPDQAISRNSDTSSFSSPCVADLLSFDSHPACLFLLGSALPNGFRSPQEMLPPLLRVPQAQPRSVSLPGHRSASRFALHAARKSHQSAPHTRASTCRNPPARPLERLHWAAS